MSSLDTKSAHETTYSEQQPVDLHIRGSSSLANTANTSPFPPTVSISESLHPITDHPNRAIEAFNDAECSMTLRQGVRLYPKAITWSVLLSMTLIMEGYSTILVPNLFAMGPFKEQFGSLQPNGDYEISATWQSAFVNGGLVGQILGLFATGTLAEYFGYRRALMAGLITMALFILIPFFATKGVVLLIGQCMLGMPWGMFQCISTVYAADVCPVALRAYLTTYVNACWVLGQLVASIVLRSMITDTSSWAYRTPFALQWIFPVPILVAVYLAPESPWWLIRQDNFADAKKSLRRLRTKPKHVSDADFDASLDATMHTMVQTNEKELLMQSGTSYKDCFKGVDRRRTEITCMVWMIQTLCGGSFMGFSTYFYEQAGLGSSYAFSLSLGQFALGLLGVVISWALMVLYGRRSLYLCGQVLTFAFVLSIGILAFADVPPTALNWAIAALLLAFTLTYDATIGPICYALVSEMPSTRLRSKTIVLARNCYNVSGIVANVITPRMLNPTAWGWGARTGYFWAGTSIIGIMWSWFRLPEPKNRTFGELDELFERKVAARKFKNTNLRPPERAVGNITVTVGKRTG
ncbi:hypothetical protein COCSADRAFT_132861 [Bipolaris sorokiniana ND90Pr]|uniref:Major facilitator superfamily (MFS) profile domain-containing protein n=1 Tax=Cochliobolus sativus (strain ND90Pr / ATCC 201652) TaxID=665912 RepID=M2SSM1_COCSN|nr:uncharacterized protein COCSADRAFT_132861 [Bipolaris sorokiniana ND90Pr]EMD70208.1 hypothetical protein COCSADRAFT_132861 [Bipolaris sorokiniana ND90Pr]